MYVAVSGGTGFIGSHLIRRLVERGDDVILVSRGSRPFHVEITGSDGAVREQEVRTVSWSELERDCAALEGIDGWVNLAGESINRRWTEAGKREVLESRLRTTSNVAAIVERLTRKPRVVVNGSGMSVYGTSDIDRYDERSPARNVDFLSSVVEKWEQAADRIQVTRIVKIRVGLVLGAHGGALPQMALPYKLYIGGRIGSGSQPVSWIHIEDMVRLILHSLDNESVKGPLNATAPNPVTNDQFGRTLGRVLKRPHYFPVPGFMLKLMLGEMAALVLEGQYVLPSKALESGFAFRYPELESALRALVSRH